MMMGNRNVNERRPVALMIDAWLDAMFVACAQSGRSVIHAPAIFITADTVKKQLRTARYAVTGKTHRIL